MRGKLSKRTFLFVAALAALFALSCATDTQPLEDRITSVEGNLGKLEGAVAKIDTKTGRLAAPARDLEFYMTAVEWKGSTSIDALAAPQTNPVTLSAGYRYKAPGAADKSDAKKWEVSTYAYAPGSITVNQGDRVTLRIFAVNGDVHGTTLIAPDGSKVAQETVNRGREYKLTFAANQVGTYRLICADHAPTMQALVTVLPSSS